MSRNVKVRIKDDERIRVRSSLSVTKNLEDFSDIDVSNLENGSVLVYKTFTERWTATRNLNQQIVDGGEF